MPTLLLRLCGPLQSWGVASRFEQRDTGMEPSKSGVVGILAAALGRPRGSDLRDLADLRMGVRVLREGRMQADFQTVGGTHRPGDRYGVARFDGSASEGILTTRYYLADADFLVGLESDNEAWLQRLDQALCAPRWPLSLGRKAYVPSVPIPLPGGASGSGVRDLSLRATLLDYPWSDDRSTVRCIYEDQGGREERHDQPVTFNLGQTRYVARRVRIVQENKPSIERRET